MKVCFVCPYAYPLFDPSAPGRFGGAEVYAWLFAKHLAERGGFDVSFAVFDRGQPRRVRLDGIDVFALPSPAHWSDRFVERMRSAARRLDRFPWLAVKRWSANSAWQLPLGAVAWAISWARREVYFHRLDAPPRRRALEKAAADVYLTFGTHHITAEVVAFCRRAGRKSLCMVQSDYDLLPQYQSGSRATNLYAEPGHICHYGLAHADLLVAQTEWQQATLRGVFHRESALIAQPIDLCQEAIEPPDAPRSPFVAWIGKADDYKRPYLCLDLARLCPNVSFLMIMNRAEPHIFGAVVNNLPPNVRLLEFVPFPQIEGYIRRAAALVSTSAYEGFPHVFLQAGKYGVPVVSLKVDPDSLLSTHGCGMVAHDDLPAMADGLRLILSDEAKRQRMGENLRRYVRSRHAASARAEELAQALERLGEGRSPHIHR